MMKVLVGHFTTESNENVKKLCELNDFVYKTGSSSIDAMDIKDIFEAADIELIPSIYANGHSNGVVSSSAFHFISTEMFRAVKLHSDKNDLDGIFLFLHGASKVKDLEGDSGEQFLIDGIRKIVGDYLPIAVVSDPHGNLSKEYVEKINILRCFRHSPHTDRIETHRHMAKLFIEFLNNRQNITPVYRKLPLLLGGERCVSTDEPMVSINKLLDEIEESPQIRSASYHIGYLRHDSYRCGAAVVVVPYSESDIEYANEKADEIADYVLSRRHDFHYTGNTQEPEEALKQALEHQGKLVFITDSGDNTTSGSSGYNTIIVRQILQSQNLNNKKILFAAITDPISVELLKRYEVDQEVAFSLGMNEDEYSAPAEIKGRIKAKGCVHNSYYEMEDVGDAITVSVANTDVDIIVSSRSITYSELHQFEAANIDIEAYDIIIVKQGYLFPDLKEIASFGIMSLTRGATNQKTESITYRKIMRPMFPIDYF